MMYHTILASLQHGIADVEAWMIHQSLSQHHTSNKALLVNFHCFCHIPYNK